ncbi:hypothetical protein [Mongoliitalea lutea]|uniref:Uncharacterized protein n=1 Tax=Mongoliitalea lutea TaxID=849756 RepID=A0A8J3D0E1_9BACT|nr:hypothetical protein [Mongoliitalea lutea]GHB45643.1 hypothetical protein GCM10008106_28340 [Mongoliitalea lutea]
MRVEDKRKILEAYLDKTIDKEEMKFLLDNGLHIPIIEWIPAENKAKEEASQKRRELLSRVFGMTFPKIEWI